MKVFRKTLLLALSIFTLATGAVGFIACDKQPVVPDDGSHSESLSEESSLENESSETSSGESSENSEGGEESSEGNEESSEIPSEDSSADSSSETEQDHSHVWDNGTVTEEATCTQNGIKTYQCENCEETKTEAIPMTSHNLETVAKKDATCEEIGWLAYVVCQGCGYSTYTEIPALGHSYGRGIVTKEATCEEAGVLTYSCSCGDFYTREIEATGHSYGVWKLTSAAACETEGVETRTCVYDPTHTETRAVKAIGHDFGEWTETKAPTCAVVGQEERTCKNDSAHAETRDVPRTTDHSVNADGVCTVCEKTIKNRLATPENLQALSDNAVAWNVVSNASYYLVHILPNDVYVDVETTSINLEEYFAGNKQLGIYVQAVADEDGEYINSEYSALYNFTIQGETVVGVKGIGDSVNLITGSYTDFASGTTKIFDETLFNRLRISEDTTVKGQSTTVTFDDTLSSYLDKRTTAVDVKVNTSASVSMGKKIKATSGYDFALNTNYERKSQGETASIFYDLDSYYIDKKVELDGYNSTERLTSILSEAFLADAMKVNSGTMSAANFIARYGTHVVTAGIYGAKFNAHYELITSKTDAEEGFTTDFQLGITSQISGKLKGVNLGLEVDNSIGVKDEYFQQSSSSQRHISSTVTTLGGGAVGVGATTIDGFAAVCGEWASSLSEDNYVLIDVPDGSLFFVWDFLDDDYTAAKSVLNEYFFSLCDKNYEAIKSKMGSIYTDSVIFNEETGVLTVDVEGLQLYAQENTTLENFKHEWYADNVFTVYKKYEGVEIAKVCFKGGYYQDDLKGQVRTTKFENFSIYFDEWWDSDIVVEFDSFAYKASAGKAALDLSAVRSENITIYVKNAAYIKGGDGGESGCGILATGKNVSIIGDGILEIVGGAGADGEKGKDESASSRVAGGKGEDGVDGFMAVDCQSFTLDYTGSVTMIGGNGGNGGDGGDITGYSDLSNMPKLAAGGDGGKGGNGAQPVALSTLTIVSCDRLLLQYGNGGNGGCGGQGGNAKECDSDPDNGGNGGSGGDGGSGFAAGNGGNGGNGGHSYGVNRVWPSSDLHGTSGNGGDGGNGGNKVSAVSYADSSANKLEGTEGGAAGARGERGTLDSNGGIMGTYGSHGDPGAEGGIDDSYYELFESLVMGNS